MRDTMASFPLSVHLDLPSGFISTRCPFPITIVDFSIDDWKLYCLRFSWRCDGVKRPTPHRALSPPVNCGPIECNLVVPSDNTATDFALRGQAMTSKLPSFVWFRKVENHFTSLIRQTEPIRSRKSGADVKIHH